MSLTTYFQCFKLIQQKDSYFPSTVCLKTNFSFFSTAKRMSFHWRNTYVLPHLKSIKPSIPSRVRNGDSHSKALKSIIHSIIPSIHMNIFWRYCKIACKYHLELCDGRLFSSYRAYLFFLFATNQRFSNLFWCDKNSKCIHSLIHLGFVPCMLSSR